MTRAKDQEYTVEWFKNAVQYQREAIARHGASRAITEADTRLLHEIQTESRTTSLLTLKDKTKVTGRASTSSCE